MTHLGHELAAALYLGAALCGLAGRGRPWAGRVLVATAALGALAHAAGLYGLHFESPPVPLESLPGTLSLFGWLIVVAFLSALLVAKVRPAGVWVSALAGLSTASADLGLWLREPSVAAPVDAGAWPHAHVLLSASGFSLLALSSLAGLGYLAKERELKRKRPSRTLLPALESIDRVEHATLALGFALLTLGVGSGFLWVRHRGTGTWSAHSLFLLAAWVVYLIPVGLRVVRHQHGPRPARGVVVSFAILAVSYLGVRLLGMLA